MNPLNADQRATLRSALRVIEEHVQTELDEQVARNVTGTRPGVSVDQLMYDAGILEGMGRLMLTLKDWAEEPAGSNS